MSESGAVTLVEFLLARVAELEELAGRASPGPWKANAEHDEVWAVDDIHVADGFALSGRQLRATVDHIVAWDPERVLAECQARRAIIEEHDAYTHDCPLSGADPCRTLRLLAQPFKDHPDFSSGWLLD